MPRPSPVSFDDLALELEIDLLTMRDKEGFRRRLKHALAESYARGARSNKALGRG